MTREQVARICHEANRGLCESHGDTSQPPWDLAPAWQRGSALLGVEFNLANPAAPPSASHDSWMAQKAREGWVYGPTKDPNAKTHPCMVPFHELPKEQQAKDHLFRAIVATLSPFLEDR